MFLESILFLQKLKISKTVLPCFGDLVAGQTSRMPQLQTRGSVLVTCSRVKGPLARDFLAGRPSSHEKHLENFFIILTLSVLAACPGDLLAIHPSHEKCMFGKKWVSF